MKFICMEPTECRSTNRNFQDVQDDSVICPLKMFQQSDVVLRTQMLSRWTGSCELWALNSVSEPNSVRLRLWNWKCFHEVSSVCSFCFLHICCVKLKKIQRSPPCVLYTCSLWISLFLTFSYSHFMYFYQNWTFSEGFFFLKDAAVCLRTLFMIRHLGQ